MFFRTPRSNKGRIAIRPYIVVTFVLMYLASGLLCALVVSY